jgi:tetratricopeptide (TPR) repeat protein
MTAPGERPVAPPDWITAEQASVVAEPPLPVEAAATPAPEIEATGLAAAAKRPEAEMPASERREHESAVPATSYAPGGDVDKLSRLADRLAAARKAKEAEIEARFAEQRAEQEAARRQVWESMQAKKAAVEAATQVPAAPERPERPKTSPLLPLPAEISALVPPVEDEAWTPAVPPPRRGRRRPTSRYASQDPERVLDLAREYLADGEPASAAEAMEHLVRSGAKVDAVIQVLEVATRAHPRDVALWRALGDAYVHSNRLQDALDTYRQAMNRL